jgi:predicted transglutaminase-like cysteine proteinase
MSGSVLYAASVRHRPVRTVPRAWRTAVAAAVMILCMTLEPNARALDTLRLQQAAAAMGPRAERMALELRDLLARVAPLDDPGRLEQINRFYNRQVSFGTDQAVWGQVDHWATPLETLSKGLGDCEDYAIGKYFTLLSAGVSAQRLRLVYVRAQMAVPTGQPSESQAHMVLAYYADTAAEPLILDNLMPDIRPASRRPDLTPVFSFNRDGLWNGAGPHSAGDPQARVSRWRDVLQRVRAEGFE